MPDEQLVAGSSTPEPAARARKARVRNQRAPAQADTSSEGHRPVPFTDEIGDWDIEPDGRLTCWRTPADMASDLGISTRRLLQLENLGMPARGSRGSCRYPVPHAVVWFIMYRLELTLGRRVTHLDMERAFERYDKMNAVADVEFEYRMRRNPKLRARVEKIALENALADRRPTAKTTAHAQRAQRAPSKTES